MNRCRKISRANVLIRAATKAMAGEPLSAAERNILEDTFKKAQEAKRRQEAS